MIPRHLRGSTTTVSGYDLRIGENKRSPIGFPPLHLKARPSLSALFLGRPILQIVVLTVAGRSGVAPARLLLAAPGRQQTRQDERLPPPYIGPPKRGCGVAGMVLFGLQRIGACALGVPASLGCHCPLRRVVSALRLRLPARSACSARSRSAATATSKLRTRASSALVIHTPPASP
jgi:hypothetical protein